MYFIFVNLKNNNNKIKKGKFNIIKVYFFQNINVYNF